MSGPRPGKREGNAAAGTQTFAPWVPGLLLMLLTLLAYWPALHGGFIWDDDDYVTGNATLRDAAGLRDIWTKVGATPQYYPLVHTMFWVEYHLWGLHPSGYHLVNVLLQAGAAVLLWRVLARLQLPGAWLAAGIFAVHPVGVESVAWITERKNVLSGVFYLAAALAWLHFAEGSRTEKIENPPVQKWRWYFAALVFFICAMFSKTVACSLPAALLLVGWWREGRWRRGDVLRLLPFFAVGGGLAWLTAWMEKHTVGALGADWSLTWVQRGLIAGRALWFYAGKLAWPAKLIFIYPRWEVDPAVWWQWLFPVLLLAVVGALWCLRRRIGRGPLAAVLFFAGALFPALGFINLYPMRFSFVADHFQYLAGIGLMVLLAAGLQRILPAPGRRVTGGLILAVLGMLTWRQCGIYQNVETLWRDTLAKNPRCWMADNNLGQLLAERGETAEAEAHYRAALQLKPDDEEAVNNLGQLQYGRGRTAEALELYRRALQIEPNDPHALNNLGVALLGQGREAEADEYFKKSLSVSPDNPETLNNLGAALVDHRRFAEAVPYCEQSLRAKPEQAGARVNLGNVLLELGRPDEAIAQFRQALRYQPGDLRAHNSLAKALAAGRNFEAAVQEYTEVLRLAPDDATAHYNLAVLLGGLGRPEAAIAHYQAALRGKPGYAEAHNNLGVALTLQGKLAEALGHYQEAVRLKPDYAEAHNNFGYVLKQLNRRDEAVDQFREALRINPDYEQPKKQLQELDEAPP